MIDSLIEIKEEALKTIATISNEKELNDLRIKYLGKKGSVTLSLKKVGAMTPEERPAFGQKVNEVKKAIEEAIKNQKENLSKQSANKSKKFKNPFQVTK